MKKITLMMCLLLVSSSVIYARRVSKLMSKLEIGMTTEQVVQIMGNPESVSTINSCTYYNYLDQRMDPIVLYVHETWYYVRFINGKVDSFGMKGDFDSTKDPKQVIDVNVNKTESKTTDEQIENNSKDAYDKLKNLKRMWDEGLITEDEYNTQKARILETM